MLDSGFCVTKIITYIKSKVVYVADLIKKLRYLPKGVPGDLIYTHFEYIEVGGVGIIEAKTEYNKLFRIFL